MQAEQRVVRLQIRCFIRHGFSDEELLEQTSKFSTFSLAKRKRSLRVVEKTSKRKGAAFMPTCCVAEHVECKPYIPGSMDVAGVYEHPLCLDLDTLTLL